MIEVKSHGRQPVTCPVSGTKSKAVKSETLRSLVRTEQQARIGEGPYYYCDAQGCDVVYFAGDGSHVFALADLTVRVGVKEREAPRPICYCFGHTVEEVLEEIRRTGRSTVADDIRTRLKSEGCDCEHTNPQGSCCLGVVTSFMKEGMKRFGGGVAATVGAQEDCCGLRDDPSSAGRGAPADTARPRDTLRTPDGSARRHGAPAEECTSC